MTSANSTTAPAAGGRFVVVSDQLELVGVLEEGRRLVLYLDRFADNAPLRDARIELELGAQRLQAAPDGERYVVELDVLLPPGVLPVVATVIAADVSDLLAGELTVLAPDAPGSAEERGDAVERHRDRRRRGRGGGLGLADRPAREPSATDTSTQTLYAPARRRFARHATPPLAALA